jgi:hypothetical protein
VRGGRQRVDALRGAQLLTKREPLISPHGSPSQSVYRIAFKATLVGHCYVQLENSRALTQAELNNLLQFQPGDDWLSLVKKLRPYNGKGHAVGDWHFYLPIDYPPLIHRYFSPLLSQTKPM